MKWRGLFFRINHLLRCWVCLSLANWIGTLTLSLSLKCFQENWSFGSFYNVPVCWGCFVSLQIYHVALHGILLSCLGWCSLLLLRNVKKQICRTVGSTLAASLEPFPHRWNVTSLRVFYRYYFGRCSSELAQVLPFPYSWGIYTRYSDRLHNFSVTVPRCYKDVFVNSFFLRRARLWNSLSM